jgi:hypothetical protein
MRLAGLFSSLVFILGVGGCVSSPAGALTLGDIDDCSGVTLVVDYGLLAPSSETACVELGASEALAKDVLSFAGLATEGTGTYGDAFVCRVNGLPSESEPFVVEGEAPHAESCADTPPVFGYWALWIKDTPGSDWAYAQEGVGTLLLAPGNQLGLVFSTGGETPTPTNP